MLNRKFLLGTTVIAGLAAAASMVSTTAALAQEAAPAPAPAAVEPVPAVEDEAEVEALIVTGSRIKQTEFTSSSPIQVITAETSALKGVADTAGLLQSSTLAAGSPQINSLLSSAFVTNGGPGASTVSLRGLGANRTLVLLNGRRAGPAGTRGAVSAFDLNVIPQSSIDRVEILKDGASSVYGSDAVAGVVNIITKKSQDGAEFEAFASRPFESGGESYRFNGSWGKTFDRGYISVAGDYYLQTEQTLGDRPYTNCIVDYTRDPLTGKRNDDIDPRTGKPGCNDVLWGHVWLYDYTGIEVDTDGDGIPDAGAIPSGSKLQYDYDGDLGQYIPRRPGLPFPQAGQPGALGMPDGFYFVGYDRPSNAVQNGMHPFVLDSTLVPEVERATLFVNGEFQLTPNIDAYGELLLNRRASKSNGFRQFWSFLYTSDAFGGGDPMSAGFTGDYLLSPTPITDHADNNEEVLYGRLVGGLRGTFGSFASGWNWDVFTQLSRSDGDYTRDVILKDAVDVAELRTASCVGTTLPVSGRACQDIDWLDPQFLAGNLTDAERAFLFDVETGNTVYTQAMVEGSVAGDLWTLPAGPIGAALGFQYRRDELRDVPGKVTLAGNAWGSSASGITAGDDTTAELFGELQVPVAKGLPGIENLSVSLSGRWTDVESYGSSGTYKVGLNWQITPAFRVRATKGTSFRAPALFEQYLADETSFPSQGAIDPCVRWGTALAQGQIPQRVADNCAAAGIPSNHTGAGSTATVFARGSTELEAETSDAFTVGLIWSPSFLDLQVAIDYFEIELKDEVTQLGASAILYGCYNSEFYSTNPATTDPLCNLFERDPGTLLVTEVRDQYINIANQVNRGIDLTIRYTHELDFGRLTFDSQFTWQLEDQTALFPGYVSDSNGDVGDPDFVGNLNFRFDRGDWTVNWGVDLIGKTSEAEDIPDRSATRLYKIHNEFTAYHSLSLRKKQDSWTLTGGVANLFDEAPPAVSSGLGQYANIGPSAFVSQYDFFGRRMFFAVQKSF